MPLGCSSLLPLMGRIDPTSQASAVEWGCRAGYKGKGFALDTQGWPAISLLTGPQIMHFAT